MAIDISNPGGSEAALKAALGDLVGWNLISRVEVSSPVEYVDVALPAGYSSFLLLGDDVRFDTATYLAFAASADGGVNFYNDTDEFDTYKLGWEISGDVDNTMTWFDFPDAVGALTIADQAISSYTPTCFECWLFPGSASKSIMARSRSIVRITDGSKTRQGGYFSELNPDATIPPALARINFIRLLPYGNGDVDPPTSGDTITAGTLTLFGIPE